MLNTSTLRSRWSPHCQGPWLGIELNGGGRVCVRPSLGDAVRALDACLRTHNYETRRADTGAFNCRFITGGSDWSLHAYGIAIDINWQSNPYGPDLVTEMPKAMRTAIKAIRTNSGDQVWGWGGDYRGNKDAMHYEVVCSPASIASGIDLATLPSGATLQRGPVDWAAVRRLVAGIVFNSMAEQPNLPDPAGNPSLRHLLLRRALNIVINAGLPETFDYDAACQHAVATFQDFLNAVEPGTIPDNERGAVWDATRWWLCVSLSRIRDGLA